MSCTDRLSRIPANHHIHSLVNDFVLRSVPLSGGALQLRKYCIDRLIPTLIIAVESLLLEVDRRNLVPHSYAHSSTSAPDHTPLLFNPIVWLAQFLFRHNPKHTNHKHAIHLALYSERCLEISNNLELQISRIRRAKIDQLAADRHLRDSNRARVARIKKFASDQRARRATRLLVTAILTRLDQHHGNQLNIHHFIAITHQIKSSPSSTASLASCINKLIVDICLNTAYSTSVNHPDATLNFEFIADRVCEWTSTDISLFLHQIQVELDSGTGMLDLIHLIRTCAARSEIDDTVPLQAVVQFLQLVRQALLGSPTIPPSADTTSMDLLAALEHEIVNLDQQHPTLHQVKALVHKIAHVTSLSYKDLCSILKGERLVLPQLVAAPVLLDLPAADSEQARDPDPSLQIQNTSATEDLDRHQKLCVLYDHLNSGANHLIARRFNALVSKAVASLSSTDIKTFESILESIKFAVPVLQLSSYTVSKDYFIDYVDRKLSCLSNDADFDLVLGMIKAQHGPSAHLNDGPINEIAQCEKQLDLVCTRVYSSYQDICTDLLLPTMDIFKLRNSHIFNSLLRVDIALNNDSVYTILASSIGSQAGVCLHGDIFDKTFLHGNEIQCLVLASAEGTLNELNQEMWLKTMEHADEAGDINSVQQEYVVGHVVTVPAKTTTGEIIGCVHFSILQSVPLSKSMTTTRTDLAEFGLLEVELARRLARNLEQAICMLDRLSKTITIVQSSSSYIRDQASANTNFYLVEGSQIYSATPFDPPTQPPFKYLHALNHKLTSVTRNEESEYIFQASETRDNSTYKAATAVPILDSEAVVAVLVVTPTSPSTRTVEDDDMHEVSKIVRVLGTALSCERHKRRRRVVISDDTQVHEFSAEDLFESDSELIFGKFMLDSVRDSISKLDSSAIAELKSYKKPPPTIHKVLQSLCYLFGKTARQVKSWSDALKFINLEILKQMVAYNPTSIQSKTKFIRIKKKLKTIPHGDIRKRGSVPAQHIYAWLIVSLDLRERAVAARRRAAVVVSQEDEMGSEADDNLGDDTDVDE